MPPNITPAQVGTQASTVQSTLTTNQLDPIVRILSDIARNTSMQGAMFGNNAGNVLSRLFYGQSFNPTTQGTLNTIASTLSMSKLGQALGMDNPMVGQRAIQSLAEYYNGPLDADRLTSIMPQAKMVAKYAEYNRTRANNLYKLSTEDTQAMIHAVAPGNLNVGDINEFNTAGEDQETKAKTLFDKAAKSIAVARKILGMSGSVSTILQTASTIGGLGDAESNLDLFNSAVGRMLGSKMDLTERQAAMQMGVDTAMAYRKMGYGSIGAGLAARESMNMFAAATEANRGGAHLDKLDFANRAAERSALYQNDLRSGGSAAIALLASSALSRKDQAAFRWALERSDGTLEGVRGVVNQFGLGSEFAGVYATYVNDPKKAMEFLSKEDLATYQKIQSTYLGNLAGQHISQQSTVLRGVGANRILNKGLAVRNRLMAEVAQGKAVNMSDEDKRALAAAGILQATMGELGLDQGRTTAAGGGRGELDEAMGAINPNNAEFKFGDTSKLLEAAAARREAKIPSLDMPDISVDFAKSNFISHYREQAKKSGAALSEGDLTQAWNTFNEKAKSAGGGTADLGELGQLVRDKNGRFSLLEKDDKGGGGVGAENASQEKSIGKLMEGLRGLLGLFFTERSSDAVKGISST